ncbi:AraC family transcriptional regulator [Mucilaginibacter humi]|uniref:AraC family transcriptional regulator n=1 Tax=Mucilaginibacter humi TaxID=2732510 RepID=UPI003744887F
MNEVLRRIPLERHKTLVGIALDAGFSSRSTFQQVFRQHTGKQPSEFLPKTSEIAISDV